MTQVCYPIGGVYKRTAICCRSFCKWLLQVRPFATVYFTCLAFQWCQMLSKKQAWQWPWTFEKNTESQGTGQTSQPNLQDEAPFKVCFPQIGPAGTAQLLPRSGRNLIAKLKVQLLQGRVAQDLQQVCGPIGTSGVSEEAPGVIKRGRWGYTAHQEDGISRKVPLCHANPNPPKTSPLWGVGPIII